MTKVIKAKTSISLTDKQRDELLGSIFKTLCELAEETEAGTVSYNVTLPNGWVYSVSVKPPRKKKK